MEVFSISFNKITFFYSKLSQFSRIYGVFFVTLIGWNLFFQRINTKFCEFVLYSLALHLLLEFCKCMIISPRKDSLISPFLSRCFCFLPFSECCCQHCNTMLSVMMAEGTLDLFLLRRDSPFV